MAGRIRCTVHLIETTYETTTPGRKGDDVSNADELHSLLHALRINTLSKADNRLARMQQVGKMHEYDYSSLRDMTLHILSIATTVVVLALLCRSRLRSVFINTPFAIASSPHHVMATVTLHTNSTALKK
jgi:hypothetical protein